MDDDQALSRKMVKDAVGRSYNGFQLRVELVEVPIERSKTSFNLRKKIEENFTKLIFHGHYCMLYCL